MDQITRHEKTFTRPKPKRPYRRLAAILVGSVLAFPVVALASLFLVVLGGEHVITASDGRAIAKAGAVAAGLAAVGAAAAWADQSEDLSTKARSIGWSLVLLAAVPGALASVYFIRMGAPHSLVRPSVTGSPRVGSVLAADPGRWSTPGHLSFDFQWETCGRLSCGDIYGATGRTYTLRRRDLHHRIRLSVVATASGNRLWSSDWVESPKTALVR